MCTLYKLIVLVGIIRKYLAVVIPITLYRNCLLYK